ncbi:MULTISPECIES: PDR/VanB family oxidoreductase [unclassified Nocardioides]|uniref:PDR/VanB family oxidoreductase n=1 Tax=unclassified Nocardioides TaxID=2615069 RepID=UPI0009EF83A0|nr:MULTISPECIES: ferredoxin reductase [unclassified Nocardioides]GAW51862.1 Flavodoxin reductase [Nocardioides sp. PD653-B2]GAW53484.1 Flavodoxin reductase [Nocardioides sp. PD653]
MVEQRELRVTQMTLEAEGVLSLRLSRIEGNKPLPAWDPGAHIDVYVPDGTTRQYSLCGDPRDLSSWQIAVLREPQGRGGSAFIHDELRVGDRLLVTRPKQSFALEEAPYHALVAGGVGITPIMAFAEHLDREGRPFRLTYGGRTEASMAFGERLRLLGDRVTFLAEDRDGRPDLDTVVKQLPDGGLIYVCGPLALLQAVQVAAEAAHGPDQDLVRFELFSRTGVEPRQPVPLDGDSYELVLARSGHSLRMAPDANILETVLALGIEVENDCRDGICGSCVTSVLSGTVDHQDLVLTRKEQAAMDKMMICCSKPICDRLELDL